MAEVIPEPAQEEEEEDYLQDEVYPTNETMVFWNIDYYPLPPRPDLNISSIRKSFKSALAKQDISGPISFLMYSESKEEYYDLNQDIAAFMGNRRDMVKDIIRFTQPIGEMYKFRIMVVTKAKPKPKPKQEDDIELERLIELHRVIQSLASRNLTLLLAELPEDAPQSVSLDSLLGGTQLLSKAIPSDNVTEDIPSFYTEKALRASQVNAGLFWDVEDYPFGDLDPVEIYKKIEQVVHQLDPRLQKGMNKISIQAYVDHTKKGSWNQFLSNKTWEASLYFLPGGSKKNLRLERMFHDILLWSVDTRPNYTLRTYLFVISDKVRDDMKIFRYLRIMDCMGYTVRLIVLNPNEYAPEDSEWEWLIVDDTIFIEELFTNYSVGSESKKQKLVEGSGSQHHG